MNKYLQTIFLGASIALLSTGCTKVNDVFDPSSPKINHNLEVIDSNSIRSIPDITSVAFEWQKVKDPNVIGYNFYRANMHKEGRQLLLVKEIANKYTTHYVDEDLEPNTKYVYQMTARSIDGSESRSTTAFQTQTLPRLEAVSFVQSLSDLPNRIKLIWRPHASERISYYIVEKLDNKNNNWKKVSKINGRLNVEHIDKRLGNNETNTYRIIAYTHDDIASIPSDSVTANTKPLPQNPLNIKATTTQPKKIIVNWELSQTPDVIKYEIYRSAFSSLGYGKIYEADNKTTTFTDVIEDDGKEYYYKVRAVDIDLLKSSFDVEGVRGESLLKPSKPIMTLAQIQGDKAILNWNAGDDRAISYNVYKQTKVGFFTYKTTKFTDIQGLRFEDRDIISGIEYKYTIQANDEYGLMSEETESANLILPKKEVIQ
mgnify:CR=1 FL=1